MFKDGVVVLIVGLIAVGAGVVWWTQVPARPWNVTAVPQIQEPETPSKAAPAVVKPAGIVAKPARASALGEQPAGEGVPSADLLPAAPIVHPEPPPFPAVEEIVPGVRMDSITEQYGQPALSTVTLTEGHLVETIIYAGKPNHAATIIRLEDGRVAAAYSRPEPVHPAGLSVPRRGSSD
jgi:hypothetical protein